MGCKVIELAIMTSVLALLTGCPGTNQAQPVTGVAPQEAPSPNVSGGITQEQLDEIEATRRAGMTSIVECYNDELERRQSRKLKGKVTVEIQIGTGGHALSVAVTQSTIKSLPMRTCIQNTIKGWEFPRLSAPTNYPTTFAFSPAY